MLVVGFLSFVVIDGLVVEVLQVFEDLDGVETVVLLILARERKWITSHLEDLELVSALFQIKDGFVMTSNKILSEGENIQICKLLQTTQVCEPVVEKRQIS